MSFFSLLDMLGGLAIFLFGMTTMNTSLTDLAGTRLKSVMATLTKTPIRGYLTGVGVTLVNQSSSATTVLEAVLVSAGLMTFSQSIPVTLGAELGSTFLGQLFAFPKISRFATLFVAAGFFGRLVAKQRQFKHIAHTVLGFGLLFLGMDMMSRAMEPLRSAPAFIHAMSGSEKPLIGFMIGLLFTLIVQSSGATLGLVIALALSGGISLAQAVPINLGASVGTCVTAILGSLGLNREAKRSAYIHLAFQSIGACVALILLAVSWGDTTLYLAMTLRLSSLFGGADNLARQIAMAHTLMPLLNLLLVVPLMPILRASFDRVFPPETASTVFGSRFLGEAALKEPSIALYQVKSELERLGPLIEEMFEESMELFYKRDLKSVTRIKTLDGQVDTLRREIVHYLARLAQTRLSSEEARIQLCYLFIATELENLADVIERNILDRAKKLISKDLHFSEEGFEELDELKTVVLSNFKTLMESFSKNDMDGPRILLADAQRCWELQQEYRRRHFERLNKGVKVSIDTTEIHMDLLGHYNRINRHIYHIAQNLIDAYS
jgi:phosphate:Na+ symporter